MTRRAKIAAIHLSFSEAYQCLVRCCLRIQSDLKVPLTCDVRLMGLLHNKPACNSARRAARK